MNSTRSESRISNLGRVDSPPQDTAADPAAIPTLDQLLEHVQVDSQLPNVAVEVLRIASNSESNLAELRDAIHTDPVLVAQILRKVNSAYYGLSQPVTDLKTAASLLGFREVRNLALVVFVSRFFEHRSGFGTLNRNLLWNHVLAVSSASHLVSRVCCHAVPGEAFAAGLMHDIGYILLDLHLRRPFNRVVKSMDPETPISQLEQETYGFDHAELGSNIARSWNMSDGVVEAIRYHHDPENYSGPHREIVYVVNVANYFCSRMGWTALGVHNVAPPPDRVYAGIELDEVALAIIWDELEATLDRAQSLASS